MVCLEYRSLQSRQRPEPTDTTHRRKERPSGGRKMLLADLITTEEGTAKGLCHMREFLWSQEAGWGPGEENRQSH